MGQDNSPLNIVYSISLISFLFRGYAGQYMIGIIERDLPKAEKILTENSEKATPFIVNLVKLKVKYGCLK